MAQLRISCVIPSYNRADLIGETLANILGQTRPPNEVIVVDDGSTDGSADVIAGFGKSVTLLRQANAGPAVARNRGLAASTGELIQFMDSDDLASLNKLEVQERALAASGADFAYSPWLQARLEGGKAICMEPVLQQRPLPPDRSLLGWYLRGWVIVFQCCLFRRTVLDRAGPYREDLMPTEDSELLFRIIKSGAKAVHVSEALVLYRLHGGHQISQGGMAHGRRVRDWERFTRIVAEQLESAAEGEADADPGGLATWRRVRRQALTALARIEPGSVEAPAAGVRMLDALTERSERLARRLRGTTWAAPYRAGPPSAEQAGLVAGMGYIMTDLREAD